VFNSGYIINEAASKGRRQQPTTEKPQPPSRPPAPQRHARTWLREKSENPSQVVEKHLLSQQVTCSRLLCSSLEASLACANTSRRVHTI
jgi:hypothetical protein